MIDQLIQDRSTFEIVRDKLGEILTLELLNQQQLATAAAVETTPYEIDVYLERHNPWEVYREDKDRRNPIVNVAFDTHTDSPRQGNAVDRQKMDGVFNIDCYGRGVSREDPDNPAGHLPGDKDAAFQVHRTIRMISKILMAAPYIYLELQGVVWGRRIANVTSFLPEYDAQNAINIVGARLQLNVMYNEFSPQHTPEILEEINLQLKVKREEDGLLIAESSYTF